MTLSIGGSSCQTLRDKWMISILLFPFHLFSSSVGALFCQPCLMCHLIWMVIRRQDDFFVRSNVHEAVNGYSSVGREKKEGMIWAKAETNIVVGWHYTASINISPIQEMDQSWMYRLLHNSRLKSEAGTPTLWKDIAYLDPSMCLCVRFALNKWI